MSTISVIEPKPYQRVGTSFLVNGAVPLSTLKDGERFDFRLSLDLLDVSGKIVMGSSLDLKQPADLSNSDQLVNFSFIFNLHQMSLGWVQKSQGRVALLLQAMGDFNKKYPDEAFIPVIINALEPKQGSAPEITRLHETIEQRVKRYRKESFEYREELSKLCQRREDFYNDSLSSDTKPFTELTDDKFAEEIFQMFWQTPDEEKILLDKKYKESIDWTGPLVRGRVGRWNGFDFRVYSNDHGSHFHVIHKEREIDARFSFPEIKLIDYKTFKNRIDRKTEENIRMYFRKPENFKRLETEFAKRS